MRFSTVDFDGRAIPVLWARDSVYDLQAAMLEPTLTMLDLIAGGAEMLKVPRAILRDPESFTSAKRDASALQWLAPIPRTPRNVFCLGRNYAEHIQEDNVSRDKDTSLPEHPQFFTKPSSSIVGEGSSIRLDERVTRRLDYEVELAVVIGKGGRDISESNAMDHVFGYTILNDITARDLQKRHDQWFKGKALDTSCPMGPYIVTADEVTDPHDLKIGLEVNGQSRQSSNTGSMIFKIPETISSLSAGLTLEPGDVIATGTPSGVGYAMNPRQWLKDGDVITCWIQGLGILTNTVRSV